jgi:hypothetical protein
MSEALHTVHVRVNDAATGKPTPVRIRFLTQDGKYLAPFGRHPNPSFSHDEAGSLCLGENKQYAYIDGTCEIQLPSGPFSVEVSKGPEYQVLCRKQTLGPAKISLRLEIDRWINLREQGWYSGDIGAFSPEAHAALLEGAAEDLAVINLLARQEWDHRYPNLLAFSGQRSAVEMPGHMVVVSTLNRHWVLGTLSLLYCHRVVYPLDFGGYEEPDRWTLADWCDQCHRKGGLVVWWQPLAYRGGLDLGEALADLILGKVDALQIHARFIRLTAADSFAIADLDTLWALLSAGLRVPIVAGRGEFRTVALGSPRTYARLVPGTDLSYRSWIEAIRAGRTFVTYGPLLSFTVEGRDPGEIVDLPDADRKVRVHAEARSWSPFDRLEVVANGVVVASTAGAGETLPVVIDMELALPDGGWVLARCIERRQVSAVAHEDMVTALTSPVYVRVAGQPPRVDPEAVALLRRSLDETLEWVNSKGRFENEKQKENLAQILLKAKGKILME